jgi:hypothetical protein
MGNEIQKTNGPQIQRQEFGATQTAAQVETISSALAAQARAQVEGRYIMAMRHPRDLDVVRERLLKECKRPSFADAALYEKPIGGGEESDQDDGGKSIEGPSIRFAETAMRCMTNMGSDSFTIYDDPEKRIVRVVATDFETNVTHTKDVTIIKAVERKYLRRGQVPLSSRTNSYGKTVYLLPATDDQTLNKEGALISKAVRTNVLRLIPGDLIDEAIATVKRTLQDQAAKDPDGERRKILDAFSGLGVPVTELKSYLGHDVATCSPAEIVKLRALFNAIRDGQTTWAEAVEQRQRETMATTAAPAPTTTAQKAEDLAAAAEAAQATQAAPPANGSPALVEFEKKLRETKPGPERIKLMREVSKMPADLQARARDLFNRVTDEEATR